jgi:hypothetical protein
MLNQQSTIVDQSDRLTASGENSAVNALQETAVGQIEGTDDIASDGSLFVGLTPIDIRTAGAASSVKDVGRLDLLKLGEDRLAVFHTNGGGENFLSLLLKERLEVAGDPALTSPDEESVLGGGTVGSV